MHIRRRDGEGTNLAKSRYQPKLHSNLKPPILTGI